MSGILSLLLTLAGMGSMFYLGSQWRLRKVEKAISAVADPARDLGVFIFKELRSGAKNVTIRMSDDDAHWYAEIVRILDGWEG